ncbi:hypothetical protein CDL12_07517 [Handroanthus impetiginosus]|uniref:Uncharacterized protein n=1 Tax=Handroanthus impetiginosus TaxID=429701 RepID=A0A2G9HQI8_9LAMI|nr:hypothetical protein CDL12_07517 [Handroanthus impetiginosus]
MRKLQLFNAKVHKKKLVLNLFNSRCKFAPEYVVIGNFKIFNTTSIWIWTPLLRDFWSKANYYLPFIHIVKKQIPSHLYVNQH